MPATVRAVVVRLGERGAVAHALLQIGRDVHRQQRLKPAVRTTSLRHLMQGGAPWAHLFALKHASVRGRHCRKQEARGHVFAEERAVEEAQVLLQLVRAGLGQRGTPPGGVAVTAVDHRQVLMVLVGLAQIVMVSKHRLRIHLGHHAPQFTLPDLHLHLKEEALMTRLSGMRHQREQAGQPQQHESLTRRVLSSVLCRLALALGQTPAQKR